MNHVLNLVVGDWSDDGHGKIKIFTLKCNYSKDEFMKAYKKVSEKINLDIIKNLCNKFEDNKITLNTINLLISNKIIDKDFFNLEDEDLNGSKKIEDGDISLDPDSFIDLIIAVVKSELKDFECEDISNLNKINVGGYGLFYI